MWLRRVASGAALVLLWAAQATANGRFPTADHLTADPADPEHLALRTTFGLLLSNDEARSWKWICEQALGYSGQLDPSIAIFGSGDVLVAYRRALRRSSLNGCQWDDAQADVDNADVVDLVNVASRNDVILALARDLDSGEVQIFEAHADGAPSKARAPLGDDFFPATIEVANSDPRRLYVSGLTDQGQAIVLLSDDDGQAWERFEVDELPSNPTYLSGVDPNDAQRVYARSDGETTDALLVSDDGGRSFREVVRFDTDLLGFALSPDGTQVAVGGPEIGLWVATSETLEFRQTVEVHHLSCLRWLETGLFACGREASDGWTIARSVDGGETLDPVFHIDDLAPLECDESSIIAAECPIAWTDVAPSLGIDSSSGGDSNDSPSDGAAGAPPESGQKRRKGCSLGLTGSSGDALLGLVALAWCLIALSIRSRTR